MNYYHKHPKSCCWAIPVECFFANGTSIVPASPTLHRTLYFLCFTLSTIWTIYMNSFQRLFSTRTVCPLSRPLPWRGGVLLPPYRIDRPSATFTTIFQAVTTFCDVISPPSLPGVPTWSVANATCTAWGHYWSPEHIPKGHATILSDLVLKDILPCMIVNENNGQWFNRFAMDANYGLVSSNLLLLFCWRHYVKWVLTSYSSSPKACFPSREPLASCELVREFPSILDGSNTFSTYRDQN